LNNNLKLKLNCNLKSKGLMKFRFDKDYRLVYRLVRQEGQMKIILIGLRSDSIVYREAKKRK